MPITAVIKKVPHPNGERAIDVFAKLVVKEILRQEHENHQEQEERA